MYLSIRSSISSLVTSNNRRKGSGTTIAPSRTCGGRSFFRTPHSRFAQQHAPRSSIVAKGKTMKSRDSRSRGRFGAVGHSPVVGAPGKLRAVPEGLMRATLYLSIVAFVQLFAVSMAQEKPATAISPGSASTATYITRVTVVDPENSKEIQDRTVIISGDRISE